MKTIRLVSLATMTAAMIPSAASAFDTSDVVGRWDCSISNQATRLNARMHLDIETNGAASSIGTLQVDGEAKSRAARCMNRLSPPRSFQQALMARSSTRAPKSKFRLHWWSPKSHRPKSWVCPNSNSFINETARSPTARCANSCRRADGTWRNGNRNNGSHRGPD